MIVRNLNAPQTEEVLSALDSTSWLWPPPGYEGQYVGHREDGKWVAIDAKDGDCEAEVLPSKEEAVRWLKADEIDRDYISKGECRWTPTRSHSSAISSRPSRPLATRPSRPGSTRES